MRRISVSTAVALLCSSVALAACDGPSEPTTPPQTRPGTVGTGEEPVADLAPDPQLADAADIQARLDGFAPVKLTADISHLPESEQNALQALIEAARLLDPVFDRQAWAHNPAFRDKLVATEGAEAHLAYFDVMRGPWDRQNHFKPFAVAGERPAGAGFYPDDLTAAEFRSYVEAHPDQRAGLESLFTVVGREGEELTATPYSQAYGEWLEPAAAKLEEAAGLTTNESLATFLRSRAAAFRSDDYYQSDKDWMDLDSAVEITIGPYETYEDELLGLKASFEAFVTVADPEASKALVGYKAELPNMEKNLPIPDEVKTVRGAESPIRVVDLVFTSGDARKSVQTIAFNLPNDERVRKEKGAKKVMLRNIIIQKFETIMRPIADVVMVEKQAKMLDANAFFDEVLFHELSHSLGPAFTDRNGEKVEVRVALGASYSPLEEGKADVMGAYNILYMLQKKKLVGATKGYKERFLISYFSGLFRSVRFGVAEAHGKGAAFQINYFLEKGAATYDEATGKFEVNLKKLEKAIKSLVNEVCMMQHRGDAAEVEAFLAKYGVVSPPMEAALGKLGGIPVDLRPTYPIAGE